MEYAEKYTGGFLMPAYVFPDSVSLYRVSALLLIEEMSYIVVTTIDKRTPVCMGVHNESSCLQRTA